MGLSNLTEEKVEIELGGQKFPMWIGMKELAKIQKQYSGWTKAWEKLSFVGTEMEGASEVDYDILAGLMEIAINNEGMKKETIYSLLEPMKDEALSVFISALVQARKSQTPAPKDSTSEIITHLEAAKALLLADKREAEVSAFDELLDALKEEVADSEDDPQKQTA